MSTESEGNKKVLYFIAMIATQEAGYLNVKISDLFKFRSVLYLHHISTKEHLIFRASRILAYRLLLVQNE